ncbi:MAG TPA: 3' terminal RNA ribose 2'-O-methyltransferase Hen1 [Terriglobales bacterium]|jgi:3' terminal RNA ribose 2'-O-methyltransferase Hen1|nr:3' terminal RNA ribose 2'-O-methyltransferase Hen1 [Terriglobales bacterium]
MLLTITNTKAPATDLGYLLHKNPSRLQSFSLAFGEAHVFYPEAAAERCTAALLLDIDPVGLVRKKRGPAGEGGLLEQYVNDRPYVASSFLSVAIARVFRSAMAGTSKERPELVHEPLPLLARVTVLPCRGGEELLRKLFEPLGYQVRANHHPLDEKFLQWGAGPYYTVELENSVSLKQLLTHLYVLIPVLDADKHYWIGQAEVEKLLENGKGWLQSHPEREAIVSRYLRFRKLTRQALARLVEEEAPEADEEQEQRSEQEIEIEKPIKLHEMRLRAVAQELKASGAKRVLDLGCGEGKLLRELLKEKQFDEIVGMDVSYRSLEVAQERLRLDTLPATQKKRIRLFQGSLMYKDKRLAGFDAAAVVEVIEHLDEPRFAAFERMLFEHAQPGRVVITTPNAEYNVRFPTLPAGQFRHKDHRFEWSRNQFQNWATATAQKFGYSVEFRPIGDEDPEVGAPTQMGVFSR